MSSEQSTPVPYGEQPNPEQTDLAQSTGVVLGSYAKHTDTVQPDPQTRHNTDALTALRRAVVEHRTAIHNAGEVRVDKRDVAAADAKQVADERLWASVDVSEPSLPYVVSPEHKQLADEYAAMEARVLALTVAGDRLFDVVREYAPSPSTVGAAIRAWLKAKGEAGDPLTVCYETGARALKGVCPEHHGDACLVHLPIFYVQAREDRKSLHKLREAAREAAMRRERGE